MIWGTEVMFDRQPLACWGGRYVGGLALLVNILAVIPAQAETRWMLIYYRQIGGWVNGGSFTVENHLQLASGSKAANVGLTNRYNPSIAIWGHADLNGYLRIQPDSLGAREVQVFDPGFPTDQSPVFYHADPDGPMRSTFETHWLKGDTDHIVPHPTEPVYHYDLVDGLNDPNYNPPPGYYSDELELVTWTEPWWQTFVVPPGINRLVSAKAWPVHVGPVQYHLSIHEDNSGDIETWPQVGPTAISRVFHTTEFTPVAVSWGVQDVVVTPGQRYAVKVTIDGAGVNFYRTVNDNYALGNLYYKIGSNVINDTSHDMCAVVVGIGYDLVPDPPTIGLSPTTLTPTVYEERNASAQSFTVQNVGPNTLTYTIGDNVDWLEVSPTTGSSNGEADTIDVTYDTASLQVGTYNGTITVNSPFASNDPQTVQVTLTVNDYPWAPVDFDLDNDVDMEDFGRFQACLSGPGTSQTNPNCAGARLDGDDDVDQDDFGLFQQCFSGPNMTANPDCAD